MGRGVKLKKKRSRKKPQKCFEAIHTFISKKSYEVFQLSSDLRSLVESGGDGVIVVLFPPYFLLVFYLA